MVVEKKVIGARRRRETDNLYFNTLCLFSQACVRIDCQRWYKVHVAGLFIVCCFVLLNRYWGINER